MVGLGYENGEGGESGKALEGDRYVLNYDLQCYVPVPVTGAAPVRELRREGLAVTVQWRDGDGRDLEGASFTAFGGGTGYQAVITLRAEEPYRFCPDVPFGYPAGAVEVQPDPAVRDAGERVVLVRYHGTPAL
jgi:hypothetical protein